MLAADGNAETDFLRHHLGPFAGLVHLLHALACRDQLAAHGPDIGRDEPFHQHVLLVVEGMLQDQPVVTDFHDFAAPHDRGRLFRYGFDHVNRVAVVRLLAQQLVRVLLDQLVGLGQVVVGKVRAHPALVHHARRYLDDAVDLGRETPHVVVEQQRGIAGVLGRRRDAHQRLLLSAGPHTDGHGPLPVGAVDGHVDDGIGGGIAPVIDGALYQCRGVFGRRGDSHGAMKKQCQQNALPSHRREELTLRFHGQGIIARSRGFHNAGFRSGIGRRIFSLSGEIRTSSCPPR